MRSGVYNSFNVCLHLVSVFYIVVLDLQFGEAGHGGCSTETDQGWLCRFAHSTHIFYSKPSSSTDVGKLLIPLISHALRTNQKISHTVFDLQKKNHILLLWNLHWTHRLEETQYSNLSINLIITVLNVGKYLRLCQTHESDCRCGPLCLWLRSVSNGGDVWVYRVLWQGSPIHSSVRPKVSPSGEASGLLAKFPSLIAL